MKRDLVADFCLFVAALFQHFLISKISKKFTLYKIAIVSLRAKTSASYIFFIGYRSIPYPLPFLRAYISAFNIRISDKSFWVFYFYSSDDDDDDYEDDD